MFSPLTTKFFPQKAHSNSIRRTSLLDKLNEALKLELTIVSAPAGYGKLNCQARDATALNFHFNTAFSAVNLAKLDLQIQQHQHKET